MRPAISAAANNGRLYPQVPLFFFEQIADNDSFHQIRNDWHGPKTRQSQGCAGKTSDRQQSPLGTDGERGTNTRTTRTAIIFASCPLAASTVMYAVFRRRLPPRPCYNARGESWQAKSTPLHQSRIPFKNQKRKCSRCLQACRRLPSCPGSPSDSPSDSRPKRSLLSNHHPHPFPIPSSTSRTPGHASHPRAGPPGRRPVCARRARSSAAVSCSPLRR